MDRRQPPFYLEIFGETEPTLDVNYAEVLPPAALRRRHPRHRRFTNIGGPLVIPVVDPSTTIGGSPNHRPYGTILKKRRPTFTSTFQSTRVGG